MKNIIYSIFIENSQKNIDTKHSNTLNKLSIHKDRLTHSKLEYAKLCNAEFRLFENDNTWNEFKEKYCEYEFDTINLYKIYLFEKLSLEYDNVLYLDFDVVPNTNLNFFTTFDMNKIVVNSVNGYLKDTWSHKNKTYIDTIKTLDKYSEHLKALCKRSMLLTQNIVCKDYEIANTGILGGGNNAISKLKYTEKLDEMLNVLKQVKEEQFYGEDITKLFFANNEVFFHYLLDKYNIEWFNMPDLWHVKCYKKVEIDETLKSYHMIHVINKKFDELWKILDV